MNKYYTIIIPIHNERYAIPLLLENLKQYNKNGHEIIIIDDGSTDETRKKIKYNEYILVDLNNDYALK